MTRRWFKKKALPIEVRRVKLEPDDVLVLRYHGALSRDVAGRIRKQAKAQFPSHEVLILDNGLDINVVASRS